MAEPRSLEGATVLRRAQVTVGVRPTGATRHYTGGDLLEPAAALAIARYPDDDGYYLFYLDERTEVVTDTRHDSLDRALEQAAFEYEGLDWTVVDTA